MITLNGWDSVCVILQTEKISMYSAKPRPPPPPTTHLVQKTNEKEKKKKNKEGKKRNADRKRKRAEVRQVTLSSNVGIMGE